MGRSKPEISPTSPTRQAAPTCDWLLSCVTMYVTAVAFRNGITPPELSCTTTCDPDSCHTCVLMFLPCPSPQGRTKRCCTMHMTVIHMNILPPWLPLSLCVILSGSSSSSTEGRGEPWRRELLQEAEGVSKAGLRALRSQIDEGAPASKTAGTLMNDVIVDGQELLTTEVPVHRS